MSDEKCPGCQAGFAAKPHKHDGWFYAECGRRWHPNHGWETMPPASCLRRQLAEWHEAFYSAVRCLDYQLKRARSEERRADKAEAACATLRELVRDAFSEGQRTAPTDLDRGRRWEDSDAFDDLAKSTHGQPILDKLAALKRDNLIVAKVAADQAYELSQWDKRLAAVKAENARMRDYLPDPVACAGWDDDDAAENVAADLAILAELKQIPRDRWPKHIRRAADRLAKKESNP